MIPKTMLPITLAIFLFQAVNSFARERTLTFDIEGMD